MATKAQIKAVKKYQESKDRIVFLAPAGRKDIYRELAKINGMSLNAYILSLLEAEREKMINKFEEERKKMIDKLS